MKKILFSALTVLAIGSFAHALEQVPASMNPAFIQSAVQALPLKMKCDSPYTSRETARESILKGEMISVDRDESKPQLVLMRPLPMENDSYIQTTISYEHDQKTIKSVLIERKDYVDVNEGTGTSPNLVKEWVTVKIANCK